MDTPKNRAGLLTETVMARIAEHIKPGGDGKHPDPVHHYNRVYEAVYRTLAEAFGD